MQGKVLGKSGGGLNINGVIEEYTVASGGNVNVGDFVKFINELGEDTSLSTTSSAGYIISAVALSENKIFIAHSYSNYYLYGMICTINGTTITTGTDTQLSTENYSGRYLSAVALSEDKVFIAHSVNSSNYYLYGMVCTINGTTITTGTDTQLSTQSNSARTIKTVALNENKVFIAHSVNSSSYYLYGMVCTINGTAITTGTDTRLSTSSYGGYVISAVALSEDKVFIAHSVNSSNYYLYGMVCTINGTAITTGTDTQLSTTKNSGSSISAVILNENKVFIAHKGDNYSLYGMVCTINGITITTGTDTQLSTLQYSGNTISAVGLNENIVFIAYYQNNNYYYLYETICTINGTTITTGTDTQLSTENYSGRYLSVVALGKNKVLIAHSMTSDSYLYAITYDCSKINILNEKAFLVNLCGVAKTKGTEGQTVEVYIPNYN